MNNVSLIGNITRDIELKGNDTKFTQFTVAVQRQFKNKQTGEYESDFITCKAFGKTAEIIAQHFSKGSKIGVSGNIQTGSYEKDGNKVYTTDVMVRDITFVDRKGQAGQAPKQQAPQQNNNPFNNSTGPIDINDDDLPF